VALNGIGAVVGSYYLSPMPCCLGAMWPMAGYCVQGTAGGEGLGSLLCQASLRRPGGWGLIMQLTGGEYQHRRDPCWKRNGFRTIGTLPGLFAKALGYVGCYVWSEPLGEVQLHESCMKAA